MITIPLNPTAAQAHCKILQPILEKRIRSILKNGFRDSRGQVSAGTVLRGFLKRFSGQSLEDVIVCSPSKLPVLIRDFKKNLPGVTNETTIAYRTFYNLFISSIYNSSKFSKLDFIRSIGTDTCPYCNRNYITAVDKKFMIKPPIDHYYPKTIYPFLGLSFYNLIPCCQTCNGFDAKSESDPAITRLQNPYNITVADFRFTFRLNSPVVVAGGIDDSGIEVIFASSIKSHLKTFKLDELYQFHRDHVAELILKQIVKYPASYRTDLGKLGLNAVEIDRMLLGNYPLPSDVHKRPLAKLYQDIGRELKLIK